ncbi:MAG TPA: MFS transporter [Sphingomicrobium sp.]|jgi:DHA2 family multidrug resistance protein-like MFS transporter
MQAPTTASLPRPPQTHQPAGAIVTVLAAMALVVLDAAMVNVAVPTIANEFGVVPAAALRVVSVYQTAVVMALFPCAALGESLGHRRVFSAGVVLFITSSLISACAPSLGILIAARFLQGLGGAAIMSLGVALLRQALPEHRIGAAIGWNALTVALCAAAGPALGAFVISIASWQWLFLAHLPLGLAALIAGTGLPIAPATRRNLDAVSMILSAGAFAMLVFGAESVARRPITAVAFLVGSGISFWTLVRREMPKLSPLIPVDLLRDRTFRLSVLASICCFAGQSTGMLALPFYYQQGLGETTLMTGVYMTPWPLAVAVAALVSGRLSDQLPSSLLCSAGAGLIALGLAAAALAPVDGNPLLLAALTIPCGLGFGLFQTPNNRTMFLSAPLARSGAAGGMQGTARLTGQTSGAVVMTLLFAWVPSATVPKAGLAIGGVFAVAAAIISSIQARPGDRYPH